MGRGVSIHFNDFSDASVCFVTFAGWLFLLLNNSYKWFDRCQGCRSRQSPERDRLVYFPRLQNVRLAISSLPFCFFFFVFLNQNKNKTKKQKHAARQILIPTWMESPSRVPTGMLLRASAGLRLHNAIFPVKVWRASGVSSEEAAVGTQPSEPGWGGGASSLPFPSRSNGWFKTQKWPRTNAAWRFRACLRCLTHTGCAALGNGKCFCWICGDVGCVKHLWSINLCTCVSNSVF